MVGDGAEGGSWRPRIAAQLAQRATEAEARGRDQALARAVAEIGDEALRARAGLGAPGWDADALCRLSSWSLVQDLEQAVWSLRDAAAQRRRDGGVVYTSRAASELLAAWALPDDAWDQTVHPVVVDPACGTGRLLLAAYRRLLQGGPAEAAAQLPWRVARLRQLRGVDVDPVAVAVARLTLWWAALEGLTVAGEDWPDTGADGPLLCVGNPLLVTDEADPSGHLGPEGRAVCRASLRLPEQGAHAVVANPPYVASTVLKQRRPWLRARCRQRFASARGNWDLFCPFLELSARWTRPGGHAAVLVPRALAAAPYARATRQVLTELGTVRRVWDRTSHADFDVHVYPIAVGWECAPAADGDTVARVGPDDHVPVQAAIPSHGAPWPVLGTSRDALGRLARALRGPRLGDFAEVMGGATVSEAYAMADLLVERPRPGADDLRVLNSGTLDPHQALWGCKPMRYLGNTWTHPVVDRGALQRIAPRRAGLADRPKVVVAGMTQRLEAFADLDGGWVAAKSTSVVMPADPEQVAWWAAVLCSPQADGLYRTMFGGLAMSGGYLRVGPPQLRVLPVPEPPQDLAEVTELVRVVTDTARGEAARHAASTQLLRVVAEAYGAQDGGPRSVR
jgi:methylase of polypeptide subunit release factors